MSVLTPDIRRKIEACGFSAHQIEQLTRYEALIRKWQKAINLISPATLPHIWERHILDSAQLWPIIRDLNEKSGQVTAPEIVDLGSGGGLPGLVLAVAGAKVTMVESDLRKCIFLRETAREIGLNDVTVITERIEKLDNVSAPIVTARALASLEQLVTWSKPYAQQGGHMVFLKGANLDDEMKPLDKAMQNKAIFQNSITDSDARIVVLEAA